MPYFREFQEDGNCAEMTELAIQKELVYSAKEANPTVKEGARLV